MRIHALFPSAVVTLYRVFFFYHGQVSVLQISPHAAHPGLLFPRRLILHDSHWLIKRHRRRTKQNIAQLKRAMYTNKTGGSYIHLSAVRYASTRLVPGCPWCRVWRGGGGGDMKKDHVNKKIKSILKRGKKREKKERRQREKWTAVLW